jgi:NADH-quinone oxidoreductase subunit L
MMVMTFWGNERFREVPAGGEADEAHAHGYDTSQVAHDALSSSSDDRPHHAAGDTLIHPVENEEEEHHHHGPVTPHESPWTMTVPLIVLAVLSSVGGLIGIPYALGSIFSKHSENHFEKVLEPVVAPVPTRSGEIDHTAEASGEPTYLSPTPQPVDGASALAVHEAERSTTAEHAHTAEEISAERWFTVISVLIAAAGIIGGFLFFRKHPLFKMPRFLENKYYVDEIYDATIINPIKGGSREGLWKIFDLGVIDGIVNGLGRGITEIGSIARYIQIGFVRSYAAFILLGALVVVGYFIIRFIPLVR